MNGPRPADPDPAWQPVGDAVHDALLEYVASTAVRPTSDLATRIQARLDREPDRTPPRRYVFSIVRLRPAVALGAFRQLVRVASGSGRFPALVRAQAFGLVLVTLLAMVALGVGSAIGVQRLLDDGLDHARPAPTLPTPTERTDRDRRSVAPSLTPSLRPDRASPSPTRTDPGPRPTDRPDGPDRTARPTPAQRDPGRGGSATARPTRRPTHRPRATERPEPTARPTHRPRRTEGPEPTERPEPTETPEADDHGDGRDGGGAEPEPPDDTGKLASSGI